MNITDLMQTYFGDAATEQLARAADLDLLSAQRALGVGLPLTLDALADHAATPPGQAHIAEAIDNLPRFGSVQEALAEADGAANLQQAGEFLSPVLLGGQNERIVAAATASAGPGARPGGVQRLLHMTLPLLVSFLAQRGLSSTNMGILGGLRGGVPGVTGGGPAVQPRPEPQPASDLSASDLGASAAGTTALGTTAPGTTALGASDLLDQMKSQFSGQNAERIGAAAGFGSGAQRATLATLPVVLNALVNKGRTEAGAADLMAQARSYQRLTDANGNLDLSLLNDPAETGRLEGQGRGLLSGLFGNVNEVTGRLGTALGGSGTNAGRLLSLVTPLALSLLGSRAQAAGLNAGGLSALMGGLSGSSLAGLLPAGLTGLSSLLGSTSAVTVSAAPVVTAAPIHTVPVTPASAPAPQVTSISTTSTTTTDPRRRRGFPWWLIPLLLLLLLGGCWLLQPRQNTAVQTTETSSTGATANGTGILVDNPVSDATLPAAPFTMSGTAPAGVALTISDEGQEVGQATADAEGRWSAELPAPTTGQHTYTVEGGDARSELKVNVTDEAGTEATSGGTTDPAVGGADADTQTSDAGAAGTDAPDSPASDPAGQTVPDTTGTDETGAEEAGTDETGTEEAGTDAAGTAAPAADPEAVPGSSAAAGAGDIAITQPTAGATLPAGSFTLRGTGKAGQQAELFEDDTSLGQVTVGEDGSWSFDVPSPPAGVHTYSLRGQEGNELASVRATTSAAVAGATAASCTEDFSLSITDGQTVSEPFRFGGKGQGNGYSVTVRRGARVIGTRKVSLDASCGWSYESKPGPGRITYEVRPAGNVAAEPVSTVNVTVGD